MPYRQMPNMVRHCFRYAFRFVMTGRSTHPALAEPSILPPCLAGPGVNNLPFRRDGFEGAVSSCDLDNTVVMGFDVEFAVWVSLVGVF